MTEQEKKFFKELEDKAKTNPVERIMAAGNYIAGTLKQAFTTGRGLDGNTLCYTLASLTGTAVCMTAQNKMCQGIFGGITGFGIMPMSKLDTEGGTFWTGDILNKYLYGNPLSVWNILLTIYGQKHGKENLPELEKYLKKNASDIGNPEIRLWEGMRNPYKDMPESKETYKGLKNKLEPFKLIDNEYYMAFAMALGSVIVEVEDIFPKGYNCFDMSVDTVLFFAHMD